MSRILLVTPVMSSKCFSFNADYQYVDLTDTSFWILFTDGMGEFAKRADGAQSFLRNFHVVM